MANRHTITDLYQMQALPLSAKVRMTERRIDDWVSEFGEDGVYLSFSGGKDSTVLVDIVRNVCGYRNISLVFVDVPTQYPELKQFAQTFDNLEILKPTDRDSVCLSHSRLDRNRQESRQGKQSIYRFKDGEYP